MTRTRAAALALPLVLLALGPATAATAQPGPGQPAPTPPAPPVELRAATYNIAAGAGTDRVFDVERTAAAIAELDADVVGLQEVDSHWGARSLDLDLAAELAEALDMYVGFAPIYSNDPAIDGGPRREYGVAVLSEHPIIEFTNHDLTRLSTQTAEPVPAPAPGFAEAVIQADGARVHVYSTHLDYRGDPTVRQLQVADTLEILAQDGEDASQILLGDLNARPTAPELEPLWSVLTDAWSVVGAGDGFTFPAATPDRRIDYLAVSERVTVLDAAVPDSALARTTSDHRPVVADLAVPRGVRQ